MEIRRAKREDIPRLVLLGEEFAYLSQPIHGFSVSRERIIEFTNLVIESNDFVSLVFIDADEIQGFITGVIQKIYFSEDVALQEMAWYVKKGFKGAQMIDAFEAAAREIGCLKVVVGNKPQYFDLQRFYERRGFTLLENHYVKHLGG